MHTSIFAMTQMLVGCFARKFAKDPFMSATGDMPLEMRQSIHYDRAPFQGDPLVTHRCFR